MPANEPPLIFDGLLLERLIQARFRKGRDDLIAHWSPSGKGLNVSTIYRWTRGQLPRTGKDLIKLASLLDVDPLCLLSFNRGSIHDAIEHILSWAQYNKWK